MTILIIEEIRTHIAKDKLDVAIDMFRSNCDEFTDELIIHSSKYHNLQAQIRKGLISREQSNIERNQVCSSLLELLNELDIKETTPKNTEYKITPELKDILGLAELISRRKGKGKTSTRDFFTALNTMKPNSLSLILRELNLKKALPKSAKEKLLQIPRKLSNNRILSACLTESLHELSEVSDSSNTTSTADMFIDVSKYGKGKSVEKLRKKKIGGAEIDSYVEKFEMVVKTRES